MKKDEEFFDDKIDADEVFDENAKDVSSETVDKTEDGAQKPFVLPYYFGIASLALGALFFGLSFVPAMGMIGLCLSIVLEMVAISLFKTQKLRNKMKGTDALYILSYVLFATFALFFLGGAIYTLINS